MTQVKYFDDDYEIEDLVKAINLFLRDKKFINILLLVNGFLLIFETSKNNE